MFQHERRGSLNLQLSKSFLETKLKISPKQTKVRSNSMLKLRTPSPGLAQAVDRQYSPLRAGPRTSKHLWVVRKKIDSSSSKSSRDLSQQSQNSETSMEW